MPTGHITNARDGSVTCVSVVMCLVYSSRHDHYEGWRAHLGIVLVFLKNVSTGVVITTVKTTTLTHKVITYSVQVKLAENAYIPWP